MSKVILTREEAEKVVVAYQPRKFPNVIPTTAKEFVQFHSKKEQSDFKIDKLVAQQTGVAELERLSIEEKVELEALARLKDLQEEAYRQAYQLGLDEGREKAFVEYQNVIKEKLEHMESVLKTIENLKTDLVSFNETHILRLVFYMARRLMLDQIEERPEMILTVIQQAIAGSQSEEEFTVRVSHSDLAFIEGMKAKLGKEFEMVKHAKIEASDEIRDGGCVVETNYGDVDATVEQRLEKIWAVVSEKLPKVKKVVGE